MRQRNRQGRTGGRRPRAAAGADGVELEVVIEEVGARGDGIANSPRGRFYVPLTVPGDRVRVRPLQARGDGFAAELLQVLVPGPGRAQPACPHFGRCGGCTLQHLDDATYAAWKLERLARALTRAGFCGVAVAPLVRTLPGARRRATFSCVRTGNGRGTPGTKAGCEAGSDVVVGFVVRRGHDIVDVEVCPVLEPRIAALLPALRRLLARLLPPRGRCDVAVALLDGGLDVVIEWAEPPLLEVREAFAAFAAGADLARLSWRPAAGSQAEPVAQRRPIGALPGGICVAVPPGCFLQASVAGEAALIDAVLAGLDDAGSVADLFAGAGTFALPLVMGGVRVHAVDADAAALHALSAAARQMPAGLAAPTTEVRDLSLRPLAAAELNRFQAVVFDPPRAGAAAQAEALSQSAVPTVIAVSCNPDSFARDARILADGGYRLAAITPVDQFLWSVHLELVARFHRPAA